jgi:hypothetical protein
MENFGKDFVEFFHGALAFWGTMAVLSAYCVAYVKYLQKVAARDKEDELGKFGKLGEGQLIRHANAIFWRRLVKFDFFAVLYIVACLAFIALPFALVTLHSGQLK